MRFLIDAPQPNAPSDWAEPNNDQDSARDLQTVEGPRVWGNLSIDTPGDQDWFQFTTSATGRDGDQVAIAFDRGPAASNN